MKKGKENEYVKRSQKDYGYSFKLQVVSEIERGELGVKEAQHKYGIQGNATIRTWLQKYGTFDWINQVPTSMSKSPQQKLLELEQKVKLLEKQKAQLEQQLEQSDKKSIFFDMMIELAEQEYKINIRKNSLPNPLNNSKPNTDKA
jgi:transposase-like protein